MTGARQIVEAVRELPDGLDARPTTPEDVPAVTQLVRAVDLAGCGHTSTNVDEIRDELDDPDCNWGHGSVTVWRGDRAVGHLLTYDGLASGRGWMLDVFCDQTDRAAQEVRVGLIEAALAEGRARWAALGRAADAPAPRAKSGCYANDAPAIADLESRGFTEARRFWRMRIAHHAEGPDGPAASGATTTVAAGASGATKLTAEEAPPGSGTAPVADYVIRLFRDTPADWHGMHSAFNASFQDHFDFTPMTFDDYREHLSGGIDDPTQWVVAEFDGQIVGYARGSNRYASEGSGYVASIGVLRAHRRAGVARRLLQARFADDLARGLAETMLHVDATSPTGATRLYSLVGMEVDSEFVWLHRPLTDA